MSCPITPTKGGMIIGFVGVEKTVDVPVTDAVVETTTPKTEKVQRAKNMTSTAKRRTAKR